MLVDVIFISHGSLTKGRQELMQTQAFNELKNSVPRYVSKILGHGIQDGSRTLLEILQNPHYNKQVDSLKSVK